jgi:hypothetical protein
VTAFVLIHSPLVGPLTWEGVAEELLSRGRTVLVPELTTAIPEAPPFALAIADAVAGQISAANPTEEIVLVGHSGAGPLLPAVADAVRHGVAGAIFVDSMLPEPGKSWLDRAPVELAARLRGMARRGSLPPWDRWFRPGAVDDLLPDPDVRVRFVGDLSRLPLALLEEPMPATRWAGPAAYLLLSGGYAEDAAEARARGWPVVERPTNHLAMVTEPALVADALEEALALLIPRPG